jgi:uncharacterized membrane protein
MRPVDAPLAPRHWKTLLFAVLGGMTLFDFYMDERFVLHPHSPEWNYYYSFRWLLIPHVFCSCMAIGLGPTQFSRRLRQSRPRLHRLLGTAYVVAVTIAAPLAIVMEVSKEKTTLLFATYTQASLWMITTGVAYLKALQRRITQHRQWMVRSYCVTSIFIVGKALLHVPSLSHVRGLTLPAFMFTLQILALLIPDIAFSESDGVKRRPSAGLQ